MTKDPEALPVTVTLKENGPIVIRGSVTVIDGDSPHESEALYLCRCGGSSKKPECDGSYKQNGFRSPGEPVVWK